MCMVVYIYTHICKNVCVHVNIYIYIYVCVYVGFIAPQGIYGTHAGDCLRTDSARCSIEAPTGLCTP